MKAIFGSCSKLTPGLMVAVLAATGLSGQQYHSVAPAPPSPGLVTPEIDLFQAFTSIDAMTRFADLIVEGSVESSGPTVRLDANQEIPGLETDSAITVSQTFRDAFSKVRPPATQITLTQIGGKLGGWDVQPKGIPLVQPGERYILFLRQDCGPAAWDKSGLPRYFALGAWAGLAKIVDGQIQFLPNASPALHESDGMSVASFKADLEARIGKLPGNVLVITAMERKPCPAQQ